MKRILKSILTSLIAALLIATIIVPIAACTTSGNTTVTVVSMGNRGLEGVKVVAKSGNKTAQGTTNSDGVTSFDVDKSLNYQVTFENLPKGYYTDPSTDYSIKANSSSEIKFYMPSQVITGETVASTYVYKTGDVMYDFSFTTTVGGKTVTLSEELKTKRAVLINFWGSQCSNCQLEFPAIISTYEEFEDTLSVMAIDPPQAYGDNDADIVSVLAQWRLSLPFYYGLDSAGLYKNMYAPAQNGSFALPVSVIIDRYGVVCEIVVGSETDTNKWKETIARYVADDYVQDIDDGKTSDDIVNFVPDKPADFNAQMSDPDDINRAINKTGVDVTFFADEGEYSWPWVLSSEGDSVVPLGSGHGRSYSILYAKLEIKTDQALLVDYKISSMEYYDQFAIIVDGDDLGRTTFYDSGNKGWQTALACIPLKSGSHLITFVYNKGSIEGEYDDTVYLNNLRLVSTNSAVIPSSDISYFAARDYNARRRTYETYEEVYFDETDGYYHIKGRTNAGKDPYLFLDMTHMVPYTRSSSLYEQFISEKKTTFGGTNYYNELLTYSYASGNSKLEGLVPVTQELHDILIALCKSDAGETAFANNPDIWLGFCVFYMHYGAQHKVGDSCAAIDNPVVGLAYFSAYEAKLTPTYNHEYMLGLVDDIYAAQADKAAALKGNAHANTSKWDTIITEKTNTYETYLAQFNKVDFDTIIVPRGKIAKFTAPEDGIYHFYSVGREDNPEYICEAQLYDSSLRLHTALASPVSSFDSDTVTRGGNPYAALSKNYYAEQFDLYYYLEAGDFCYINVMFYSTETIEPMYFAINRLEDSQGNALTEYSTLHTVTSGFYVASLDPDTLGQIYRPMYTGVELRSDGYYYDTTYGHRIVVDFTELTRFSSSHSLEQVINGEAKFPTYVAKKDEHGNEIKDEDGDTVYELVLVPMNFDFTGITLKIGDETIVGKNYTEKIKEYLAEAKANNGLAEADEELREILLLFIYKYDEIVVEEDWFAFCYFYEYYGAAYKK